MVAQWIKYSRVIYGMSYTLKTRFYKATCCLCQKQQCWSGPEARPSWLASWYMVSFRWVSTRMLREEWVPVVSNTLVQNSTRQPKVSQYLWTDSLCRTSWFVDWVVSCLYFQWDLSKAFLKSQGTVEHNAQIHKLWVTVYLCPLRMMMSCLLAFVWQMEAAGSCLFGTRFKSPSFIIVGPLFHVSIQNFF